MPGWLSTARYPRPGWCRVARIESLREEQTRLIAEIATRAERLAYVTNMIEARWDPPRPRRMVGRQVVEIPARTKPPQDGDVEANGHRKVTQK